MMMGPLSLGLGFWGRGETLNGSTCLDNWSSGTVPCAKKLESPLLAGSTSTFLLICFDSRFFFCVFFPPIFLGGKFGLSYLAHFSGSYGI